MDLRKLNSMTKYPSIPTYHVSKNGLLTHEFLSFPEDETVYASEKIDGTNVRLLLLLDHDFFIGSREELLYARGDRLWTPTEHIVESTRFTAEVLAGNHVGLVCMALYFEMYGGHFPASRQYVSAKEYRLRLFDMAIFTDKSFDELMNLPLEKISAWREAGGQSYASRVLLESFAKRSGLDLVPPVTHLYGRELPTTLGGMESFLGVHLPKSLCAEEGGWGKAEGLVFRTASRSHIAKVRFEDYARARRKQRRPRGDGGDAAIMNDLEKNAALRSKLVSVLEAKLDAEWGHEQLLWMEDLWARWNRDDGWICGTPSMSGIPLRNAPAHILVKVLRALPQAIEKRAADKVAHLEAVRELNAEIEKALAELNQKG